MRSFYSWSWTGGDAGPADSNSSVYFSGWNSIPNALGELDNLAPLVGEKYFTIGGGNHNGVLSADVLTQFIADLNQVQGFDGIMFDVEKVRGSFDTVNPKFNAAFAAVKAAGMKVAITVSHTAPYDTDSPQIATQLVQSFVANTDVDIISPQLYTSGWENAPDFALTGSCASAGCNWDMYLGMHAGMRFVPSLANADQYNATKAYFDPKGIPCTGYIQWQQTSRRLDTIIV